MAGDPAGYSGTPLARKLGLRDGHRMLLLDAPVSWELPPPVPDLVVRRRVGGSDYDVALAFCADARALRRRFAALAERMAVAGAIWIAWPKRASGVPTDLDENVVRAHGLDLGWVDVKVCAIDGTWSGLKFVRRLRDRG